MAAIEGLTAILLAAGRGERAGGDVAKQYRRMGQRSVLAHAYASLRAIRGMGAIAVVVGEGEDGRAAEALGDIAPAPLFVTGGAERRDSVRRAIDYLASLSALPDHILVHDSARPFIPAEVADRLLAALGGGAVAAMPVMPVTDTLVRGAEGRAGDVVPRDGVFRVQTPQAFRLDRLAEAHRRWDSTRHATDDAQMVRALGHEVVLVEGDQRLEKITMAEDFARIAALNGVSPEPRTGTGYDVHRLVPDKPLWLCGIEIPHSHGLSGHSDADVGIHALVDAILGALAEGDIGQHFPPSDPQWRGAPSYRFLEFARDRIATRGGRLIHADLTLICEAPKIVPHRAAMQNRLADILSVTPDRISVKATTTEGLGFTGRREGIAAQASATVLL